MILIRESFHVIGRKKLENKTSSTPITLKKMKIKCKGHKYSAKYFKTSA